MQRKVEASREKKGQQRRAEKGINEYYVEENRGRSGKARWE